jgi:hypothetical protein
MKSFALQNLCNGSFDFGAGDFNFIVMNRVCITNSRKHIGDRISHNHLFNALLPEYAALTSLLWLTPGIAPS